MTNEKTTCPYCKEDIKADAIKCKHCHSKLALDHPIHQGTCPYCKENINPDAIKCKHCKSSLINSQDKTGCGCRGASETNQEPFGSVALRRETGSRPRAPVFESRRPAPRNCDDCDLLLLSCFAAGLPPMQCYRDWQDCFDRCW